MYQTILGLGKSLASEFVTEQLGATTINASVWSVWNYTHRGYNRDLESQRVNSTAEPLHTIVELRT